MRDKTEFYHILDELDHHEFSEYGRLIGDFDFSRFVLKINHVQSSPEGHPTLLIVRVPQIVSGFPVALMSSPVRRTALEDFLTRKVAEEVDLLARYDERGLSKRRLSMAGPGQKILPRTSILITEEYVEARIYASLPAESGQIYTAGARDLFFEDLAQVVNRALIYCNLNEAALVKFVTLMENADHIRQLLPTRGFVSFVGENSRLEREENSDKPDPVRSVPFRVAESLQQGMELTNGATLRGLGVPQGLTLILGDAYSGRIELMRAIAHGIYNHIPGDGREWIVTVPDAVAIDAEPGRSIQRIDLTPFFPSLPNGIDPSKFTSASADACESQAAATLEALEVGARVLLFDESTSSASFITSDPWVSVLLPESATRVNPLVARARQMIDELGVSIVVGGSSAVAEFIPIADTILKIENGEVQDVTTEAKQLQVPPLQPAPPSQPILNMEKSRYIVPSSIDASLGKEDHHVEARSLTQLEFGRLLIELDQVSQLADIHQTVTIGRILYYARQHYMDEQRTIREVLDLVDRDLSTEGLECLTRDLRGDLARPRRYEIASLINRLKSLRITQAPAT